MRLKKFRRIYKWEGVTMIPTCMGNVVVIIIAL